MFLTTIGGKIGEKNRFADTRKWFLPILSVLTKPSELLLWHEILILHHDCLNTVHHELCSKFCWAGNTAGCPASFIFDVQIRALLHSLSPSLPRSHSLHHGLSVKCAWPTRLAAAGDSALRWASCWTETSSSQTCFAASCWADLPPTHQVIPGVPGTLSHFSFFFANITETLWYLHALNSHPHVCSTLKAIRPMRSSHVY